MVLTAIAPTLVERISGALSVLAVVFFAVIIVAAIAANMQVITDNFATMGAAVIVLMVIMLSLGLMSGRAMGLDPRDGSTIAIESGIQNGTLGVAVGAIVAAQLIDGATGISTFGVPSAVYGAIMYFIAVPFVSWRKSKLKQAVEPAAA